MRLWELHSPSHEPARCAYECSQRIPHLVTVMVGNTRMVGERLGSEADALDEASYLLDDYVFRAGP